MSNFCALQVTQDVPLVLHSIPTVNEMVFLPDNLSVPCNESIRLDYIRAVTTPYGCVLEYPTYRTDEYVLQGVNGTLYFREYPETVEYDVHANNDLTVTLTFNTLPKSNTYPFVPSGGTCFDPPPYKYMYTTKPSQVKETSMTWQLPIVPCIYNQTVYKKSVQVLAVTDIKELETLHYDTGAQLAAGILLWIFLGIIVLGTCFAIASESLKPRTNLVIERSPPYMPSQNRTCRIRRRSVLDPGVFSRRSPYTESVNPAWKD